MYFIKFYFKKKILIFNSDNNTIRFLLLFSKQFCKASFLSEFFREDTIFLKIWGKKLIIYALNRLTRSNIF